VAMAGTELLDLDMPYSGHRIYHLNFLRSNYKKTLPSSYAG
jgi:hypothetical protein